MAKLRDRSVLKKLRTKFIFINMMMAVLVLGITFGVVCYLDYASDYNAITRELNQVLGRVVSSMIPQVEGTISVGDSAQGPVKASSASGNEDSARAQSEDGSEDSTEDEGSTESDASSSTASASTTIGAIIYDGELASEGTSNAKKNDSFIAAPNIGSQSDNSAQDSRFFYSPASQSIALVAVYRVNNQGIYTAMPDFSSASMDESVLLRSNDIVMNSNDTMGVIDAFALAYEKMPVEDGFIVAYEDASNLYTWRDLAFMLSIVGIAALLVFFLINQLFARWALRPVSISMAQQKELIKRQQQFTADASHELKTPLTVILANMSILRSSPESSISEEMQWIESTQTEAERMQLLVNDMLELARPKDGNVEGLAGTDANFERIDFSDLVEGEVLQFESVAFERDVFIESRIDKDLYVIGDPNRFGRMVATLIDNACKYTPDGGSVIVELTTYHYGDEMPALKPNALDSDGYDADASDNGDAESPQPSEADSSDNAAKTSARPRHAKMQAAKAQDSCVMLRVHNTGDPIAEEDIPYLFDRFYRADKARTSGKGGYGLGLAIGRQIARDAGGDIGVTSTTEDGTTFVVLLPFA